MCLACTARHCNQISIPYLAKGLKTYLFDYEVNVGSVAVQWQSIPPP